MDPADPHITTQDLKREGKSDAVGRTIGRYRLLQKLGEGGYGTVYEAEQRDPVHRRVALKLIKPGLDSQYVLARFEAERQALALMDHPNIARVFDAGQDESGYPYFVMELVRGVPITEYCDQHQLDVEQRLRLLIEVCHAVQHAHQKGIIHRDLKPTNILVAEVDGKPTPKVIDFGVAKAISQRLTEHTLFTSQGQVVGTLEYMSPEQADLNPIDVDTRSDVYSLGVLLYEVLCGALPYDSEVLRNSTYAQAQSTIRGVDPPRPSTRLSGLGDSANDVAKSRQSTPAALRRLLRSELEWIPLKAMRKDKAQRYNSVEALAQDIGNFLDNKPLIAGPESARYRLKKFARRHRVGVAASAAAVLSLALGLALAGVGFVQARLETRRADRAATTANQISRTLQELLSSANPEAAKGADYTVRHLLDDFAPTLPERLADQPEAEAELQTTVGMAYWRLGQGEKSAEHLARALELRRRVFGDQHPKVADSLVDYAWALKELRVLDEAEQRLHEALAIYRSHGIEGRPIIRALAALQVVLSVPGRYGEIEAVVDEALAEARKTPDVEYPEIANIHHGLIQARIIEGRYEEAERIARECVAMHMRLQGPNHPETGWGLFCLSMALTAQGKSAEGFDAARQALVIWSGSYPRLHWSFSQGWEVLFSSLQAAVEAHELAEVLSLEKLSELQDLLRQTMQPRPADPAGVDIESGLRFMFYVGRLSGVHRALSSELSAAGRDDDARRCLEMYNRFLLRLQQGQ